MNENDEDADDIEELTPVDDDVPELSGDDSPDDDSSNAKKSDNFDISDNSSSNQNKNKNKIPDDEVYKDEPFLEKIDFGVPEAKTIALEDNKIIENFKTENLDYGFLDEDSGDSEDDDLGLEIKEKKSPADNKKTDANAPKTEEISALEELEDPEETMPFSFIPLAANDSNLSELGSATPDTIVQNSDGTFQIADKSAYNSNQGIDINFKKLVDSVLKH